jgi:hypothetical protein
MPKECPLDSEAPTVPELIIRAEQAHREWALLSSEQQRLAEVSRLACARAQIARDTFLVEAVQEESRRKREQIDRLLRARPASGWR